ncbi:MAG: ATP phosphoribosyltransferase regulatory subunit [Caulobacteraceae bacterium]
MRLEPALAPDLLAAIRAPFLERAATPIDAPVLQPLGLLLDLAGEQIRERLFVVQGEAGEERALRPDFTIPTVFAHIESGAAAGRYFYEGKAFRVAPAGSDRDEEFLQIGLEVFGDGAGPAADAEIAALAWRAASAGGRKDLRLVFGDVTLFGAIIDSLGLAPPLAARLKRGFAQPRRLRAELAAAKAGERPASRGGERISSLLSGLPEAEATAVLEELWALAGIEPVGGRGAAEIVHRLATRAENARTPDLTPAQADLIADVLAISEPPKETLDTVRKLVGGGPALRAVETAWQARLDALVSAGVPVERLTLATGFVQQFGYYDGVLFEVRSAALGEDRPIAAGGRYDGLPARLGAKSVTGALGCMVRPGRAFANGGAA